MAGIIWFDETINIIRSMWGEHTPADIAKQISLVLERLKPHLKNKIVSEKSVVFHAMTLGLITPDEREAWLVDNQYKFPRVPMSTTLKARVLSRDGFRCLACHREENELRPPENLQIDHIIPVCFGGSNETDNLQTLCSTCHKAKGLSSVDCRKPFKVVTKRSRYTGETYFSFYQDN